MRLPLFELFKFLYALLLVSPCVFGSLERIYLPIILRAILCSVWDFPMRLILGMAFVASVEYRLSKKALDIIPYILYCLT